ncbi:MAG: class I SAM-dependent methyltransferase [Nitrospirae bacterium]|nr:class I SAM-dependent methyltransferase [Nitrospirota bacterium]
MARFLPHTYSRVLEIGCGEGIFAKYLRPDSERWGIEVDESSAHIAASHMKTVLCGKYHEVSDDLPENYFDLVVCNDVIEHMEDHEEFLRSIRTKLQDSGCLVASLPNVRYIRNLNEVLFLKDWRYRDAGILDRTHLRFFTERSLVRSLSENGFLAEEVRGINRTKNPFRRVVLLLIQAVTLGYYADIQYLQFGVRARKRT